MPEGAPLLSGFLSTLVLSWPLIHLLSRRGVVDEPNHRSSHSRVTPRGGGIAVMVGAWIGLAFAAPTAALWGIWVVASLVGLTGAIDDVHGLSPLLRLRVLVLLASVLTWWLLRDVAMAPWSAVGLGLLMVVWLVGYVNAFNFMDGVNGISALSAGAAGAWFWYLGATQGDAGLAGAGATLMGASAGFLPWNAPHARVFLGDVGSYGLGMLIAGLAAYSVVRGVHPLSATAPLLLYGVDTMATLLTRVAQGHDWRQAHREHTYQRLLAVGWTHGQISVFVLTLTLVMCVVVGVFPIIPAVGTCTLLLAGYLLTPKLCGRREVIPHESQQVTR